MIETTVKKYRLVGLSPMLGSQPASEKIHSTFIASKAPQIMDDEEVLEVPDSQGLTVFYRDKNGNPILMDYQVKGFFKSAGRALSKQNGVAAPVSKVDQFVFVTPRQIQLKRGGEVITEPDGIRERPLLAMTMQGQRTCTAASEYVDDWEIVIEVELVTNYGTAKSKPVTFEIIEDWLDYGFYNGLGRWRNAGNGRFRWEEIE